MDEKIYTITLSDGTVIGNLRLNGNNFVSQNPISLEIFDGNLMDVVIDNGEMKETHEVMGLVQVIKMGEEYWFVLRDIPASEIENARLRSDLDYVMMMTNIEL